MTVEEFIANLRVNLRDLDAEVKRRGINITREETAFTRDITAAVLKALERGVRPQMVAAVTLGMGGGILNAFPNLPRDHLEELRALLAYVDASQPPQGSA